VQDKITEEQSKINPELQIGIDIQEKPVVEESKDPNGIWKCDWCRLKYPEVIKVECDVRHSYCQNCFRYPLPQSPPSNSRSFIIFSFPFFFFN
jgi:hypothetical protein